MSRNADAVIPRLRGMTRISVATCDAMTHAPSPGAARHPLPASGARGDISSPSPRLRGEGARRADEGGCLLAIVALLLLATPAAAQNSLILSATADRLGGRNGGGASVLWLHPRASNIVTAGLTFFSLPDTRWAYGTFGGTLRRDARTIFNGEANLGRGSDDDGAFRYMLVRGGVTRELRERELYAEAEWLQADVARRQNGIVRIGGTYLPAPPLTLRASLYQSIAGDDDTTLITMRGDYDLGRMIAIAGFSAGRAIPLLVQQSGTGETHIREAFAGAVIRRWTIIASVGEDRQRLSVTWRVPMGAR